MSDMLEEIIKQVIIRAPISNEDADWMVCEVERLRERERGYLAELADYGRTVERLNAEVKAEREQRNLLSDMLDKERDRSETMQTHEKAWLSQMIARCIPKTEREK